MVYTTEKNYYVRELMRNMQTKKLIRGIFLEKHTKLLSHNFQETRRAYSW